MILLFVFGGLFVLGIILYRNWNTDYVGRLGILGILLSIAMGLLLAVFGPFAIYMQATAGVKRAELEASRAALVWQVENGKYDGSSNAIGEFNADVAASKYLRHSPWVGLFVSPAYEDIEEIALTGIGENADKHEEP